MIVKKFFYAILYKKQKAKFEVSNVRYSIITEIKKSDKSNVYLASVEGHEYPVIVKEIQNGNIQVFEILKEIDSEYLPRIYHIEKIEDGLLVVEEYVDGELLADHLVLRKITEDECLDIAEQICNALDVLHSHEPILIHRDIKPSNLIITPNGKVKLIDYDSSRLYKEESDGDTRLLGTEKYAPPEQYGFSQTDCRSDIYSLGVVFEKFTDFLPQNKQKLWKQLVEKCTLFSPDSRYQNVSEVKRQISKIRKCKWSKCKSVIVILAVLFLLTIPVIIYMSTSNNKKANDFVGRTIYETTTTEDPTAEEPTIEDPTTEDPTTEDPTTEEPTTEEPTTEDPTTEEPTTVEPITEESEPMQDYRKIQPEWRNLETDDPVTVDIKRQIREYCAVVYYHFKDRMVEKDFLLQERGLESDTIELVALKLISETAGYEKEIKEGDYIIQDNIIKISNEYMNALDEGYYMLRVEMREGEGEVYGCSTYLYVAEHDVLEEPDMWLQNTTFDYKINSNNKVHAVVKNDSKRTIEGLYLQDGTKVDTSMCRIVQNGRAIELSPELLTTITNSEEMYIVKCQDETMLSISIRLN